MLRAVDCGLLLLLIALGRLPICRRSVWVFTSTLACRRIVEESLELYTCSASSRDSEMPEYARNGTVPRSYNELATLMSVTGEIELLISHSQCSLSTGTAGLLGSKIGTAHPKKHC